MNDDESFQGCDKHVIHFNVMATITNRICTYMITLYWGNTQQ